MKDSKENEKIYTEGGIDGETPEDFLRALLLASPNIAYVIDLARQRLVFHNKERFGVLGYSPRKSADFEMSQIFSFVHPDDVMGLEKYLTHLKNAKNGEYFEIEIRAKAADGSWHWLLNRATVFRRDQNHQATHVFGVATDVTNLKTTEQELRDSQEILTALTTATSEGVLIHDNGKILQLNHRALELGGYQEKDVMGGMVTDFVAPEYRALVQQNIARNVQQSYEVRAMKKDGTSFPVAIRGQEVKLKGRTVRIAVIRDLTEEKTTREHLEESERRYRDLVELSPIGVLINIDSKIVFMNNAAKRIFKVPNNEAIKEGIPAMKLIHPDFQEAVQKRIESVLIKGVPVPPMEQKMVAFDGSVVDVEVVSFPYVFHDQKAAQVIVQDITHRKKAEAELAAQEKNYRQLVENSPDAIVVHADEKLIFLNAAAVRLLGVSDERFALGRSVYDFVDPAFHQIAKQRVQKGYHGETVPWIEEELIRPDGSRLEVEISGFPIIFKGAPAVMLMIHDISQRKKVERLIRENELKLRSVFDNVPIGIAIVAEQEKFLEVNDAFSKMLGYSIAELMHMSVAEVTYPEDRGRDDQMQADLLSGKISQYRLEKRYVRKDGTVVWGDLVATVVRSEAGQVLFGLRVVEDITRRKQIDDELKNRLAEVERLNKLMIGRELKMAEFKEEIERMRKKQQE